MKEFADSIAKFMGQPMAYRWSFEPCWENCFLVQAEPKEIKKVFDIDVKNFFRFYILNNGTIAYSTPLSEKHQIQDVEFKENYLNNFKKSPHSDIEFKTISNNQGTFPCACLYANNVYEAYHFIVEQKINSDLSLEEAYKLMMGQLIEYVENVKSKITKPYC